jgi:2-isopropylmalate synthase
VREVKIVDISLRDSEQLFASALSFKQKIEIAKLLEKLHVDAVETCYVSEAPADAVLVRTLTTMLEQSIVCVPVTLDKAGIDRAAAALQKAKKPRLNLIVPTSTVQMEYVYHLKAETMITQVSEMVGYCASLCRDVEFTADDATRSEPEFLASVISAAIEAGAKTITLCDAAGEILPDELEAFIDSMLKRVPALKDTQLSLELKDQLGLAAASALAAVSKGVSQFKVAFGSSASHLSLEQFLNVFKIRGETLKITSSVNSTALQRTCRQLEALTGVGRSGRTAPASVGEPQETAVEKEELSAETDLETLRRRILMLGYDITEEDLEQIFKLFKEVARSKKVDNRDIEALIAETAGQVPPTYQLDNYVINSGNAITATAFIRVLKQGVPLQAISIGDGPIDAAFLAVEQILGHHFELEEFQIQAVTEGREAMGDALVKLRHNGKLFSGRGLSTDIIGASIRAYLSAVNKIVYEETNI